LLNESQAIGASRSDRFAEGLAVYNLAAVRAHRGDHQGAVALLERAEAIGPSSAWTAALHSAMALQLLALGHGDRARTVAEEAVESARASKIDLNIMRALAALGSAAIVQGDLGLARAASAEQIALGRSFGERLQGIGWGLALQATAQAVAEDYEGAERSFEAALVEFEAASSLPAVAEATLSMAQLREALSDLDAAEVAYRRALDIRRQIGGRHALADCLEGLAAIAASRGDYAEASHLLGEAEQTRREAGPRGWELWTGPPLPAREVWFARMREALASGV
jgi:tetratricopeptide (TPR) repeat protein